MAPDASETCGSARSPQDRVLALMARRGSPPPARRATRGRAPELPLLPVDAVVHLVLPLPSPQGACDLPDADTRIAPRCPRAASRDCRRLLSLCRQPALPARGQRRMVRRACVEARPDAAAA